jgi:hypothetical protein
MGVQPLVGADMAHCGLRSAERTRRPRRLSARGATSTLTLGIFGAQAIELAPAINLFRSRNPHCELLFREIHFGDPYGFRCRAAYAMKYTATIDVGTPAGVAANVRRLRQVTAYEARQCPNLPRTVRR